MTKIDVLDLMPVVLITHSNMCDISDKKLWLSVSGALSSLLGIKENYAGMYTEFFSGWGETFK